MVYLSTCTYIMQYSFFLQINLKQKVLYNLLWALVIRPYFTHLSKDSLENNWFQSRQFRNSGQQKCVFYWWDTTRKTCFMQIILNGCGVASSVNFCGYESLNVVHNTSPTKMYPEVILSDSLFIDSNQILGIFFSPSVSINYTQDFTYFIEPTGVKFEYTRFIAKINWFESISPSNYYFAFILSARRNEKP